MIKTTQKASLSLNSKIARKAIFLIILFLAVLLIGGCSVRPEVITQTKFQDVKVPIRCGITLPNKPNFEPNDPSSAVELAKYYKQVLELLKRCVNE